jgi:hypothetical protein
MPKRIRKKSKRTEFQHVLPPYARLKYKPGCYPPSVGQWATTDLMSVHLEALAQIDEESLDCLIEAARIEKNERGISDRKHRGRISSRKWKPSPIIPAPIDKPHLN